MTSVGDHLRCIAAVVLCAVALETSVANAAPAIQQATGKFDHHASVTITGTGFGNKPNAGPVVWDDASGNNVRDKWDLAWPNTDATYAMAYRNPQRGVSLPHNHITRYLAGAHAGGGPYGGSNVMVWKYRTIGSFPQYTYASWYQRFDDGWVFSGNNLKIYDWTHGTGGYDLPNNWYIELRDPPTSRTATNAQWHLLDDTGYPVGDSLISPDRNGQDMWWDGAVNPMSGVWTKIEVELKLTNQNDGYIKLWENGTLKINYAGKTDGYEGNVRSDGVGGYSDMSGQTNNWRYYADVYLDYTPARVVLANNANLSNATIVEAQIPTSWSSTSIAATVNLGKFTAGQTAYLFVVDPSGAHNSAGLQVTVGGTGGTATVPKPPTSVDAQ